MHAVGAAALMVAGFGDGVQWLSQGSVSATGGGGNGAGDGGSGSGTAEERLCRLGKTRARLLEKQGSTGGGNEINLKSLPSPLGSRWVTGVDFAITTKFSPKKTGSPTINKIIYLGQIKITQKDNKK